MKSKIDEIFNHLLEEVKKGRSIKDCLKDYPDLVDELEPLLKLAVDIEDLPKPELDPIAIKATINSIREIISQRQSKRKLSFGRIFSFRPVFARVAAILLLLIITAWTTVSLSANSLPGELFYPVKLFSEKVRYFLTFSPAGKAELHVVFADKRTNEFVLTFKEGDEINRDLLDSMLKEIELAVRCTRSVSVEHSAKIMEKIGRCNAYQMTVLQNTQLLICDCDTGIINNAINICSERIKCIDCNVCPDSTDDHNCPCNNE